MEQLPDEVLLTILGHLSIPDLLTVRIACKRLAELALHPLLWRSRRMGGGSLVDPRWTCPVLRLAPCLRSVDIDFSPEACHCAASTTRCAVAEVSLCGNSHSFPVEAALALVNLRRNGDIRKLHISFALTCSRPQVRILLDTVVTTPGLEKLSITNPFCKAKPDARLVAGPSLRKLECPASSESARFCDALLAAHASTLEVVNLLPFNGMHGPTPFSADLLQATAPLLANLKNMRELRTPMLPGLEAVAAVVSLKEVCVSVVSGGSLAAATSTAQYLAKAKYLSKVTLLYSDEEVQVDLLAALGSCPQTSVSHLAVHANDTIVQYVSLALPSLTALQTLEFCVETGFPSPSLIQAVSPASAPALRMLKFNQSQGTGDDVCSHTFMHRPEVAQLLQRNPGLHLVFNPWDDIWNKYCAVRRCQTCKWCSFKCRMFLEHMCQDKSTFLGMYTHDPIDSCSVDHDPIKVSWLHQPSFYSV
ncbi:F-box only protein 11 [Frankliniella fusca]|uniref:F-box only protein 11 n=1 Tax=Frankliniella fusca TaxID=407009 RepID=A0AAE1HU07_9NEOP|nr:F-box only protein 11 [Frankliniella fusca]